jgi:dihydropyrimidine dehydrogenase (NAD+) subunit PreT
VVPIPGSEFRIEVDMVVRAIGQKPVTDLFRTIAGIEVRDNGTIVINDKYHTGAQKYFAGGDCTNGGKEVVDAVAEGKAAAQSIDAWLGAPRAKN